MGGTVRYLWRLAGIARVWVSRTTTRERVRRAPVRRGCSIVTYVSASQLGLSGIVLGVMGLSLGCMPAAVAQHFGADNAQANAIAAQRHADTATVSAWLRTDGALDPTVAVQTGRAMQQTDPNASASDTLVITLSPNETDEAVSTWPCLSGECDDKSYTPSRDFGQSQAKFLGLMAASRSFTQEDVALYAHCRDRPYKPCPTRTLTQLLGGTYHRCHEAGFGYNNCCQRHGWGQDLGLAGCNSAEKLLADKRNKGLCVYTGHYCARKVGGRCVEHKQGWCCYASKLVRLIQQQGHVQLNWSYGAPKRPDCGGFSLTQFQQLNFDRMSFADIVPDMQARAKSLSVDTLTRTVRAQAAAP